MRSGEFKKITMYDESIETTTSDNSTPYESQLKKLPPSEEVKALIGRLKSALEEIDYLYEQQADFGY